MSATMRRLQAATYRILREAEEAPPFADAPPPANPTLADVMDGVGVVSQVLGSVTALHQTEIVDVSSRLDALTVAVAQIAAHVVALAEYVKYETPEGLEPMTNETHGLQEYIDTARDAEESFREEMGL